MILVFCIPHPVVKSRNMDSLNQIVPNDSVICDTNYKYEFSPEMSMQSALSQPGPAGTGIYAVFKITSKVQVPAQQWPFKTVQGRSCCF